VKTVGSGFVRVFEDYDTREGSSTSLVSYRTQAQPEEEDLADEGAEDERRNGREGER
jgi:hypothetical protein